VADATVEVVATQRERDAVVRRSASTSAATNKLLQAAKFELPCAGRWEIDVVVQTPRRATVRVSLAVEVAPAAPRWQKFWAWFCWPALPIALFALHQWRLAARD
jgi:hypothetical protein